MQEQKGRDSDEDGTQVRKRENIGKYDIPQDQMINSASFFIVTSSGFLVQFRMDVKIILLINWQNRSLNTQKQTNQSRLCEAQ